MDMSQVKEQITSLYDFSRFNKIVDIGGGHGSLITSILRANPRAFGVLFDAQEAISEARPKIEAAGLADRCAAIAGDFLKSIPAGGDLYIIKWIVRDRDDDRAVQLLRNIRSQIPPDGRVLIVDCVVPEGNETAREFEQLLAAAGFRFLRVIPTETPTSMVEAEPA
jgi:tRNA A58 N-methylase Trm61